MTDEILDSTSSADSLLERRVTELMSAGFFDGCMRMLGKAFLVDLAEAEDAVLDAVARLAQPCQGAASTPSCLLTTGLVGG